MAEMTDELAASVKEIEQMAGLSDVDEEALAAVKTKRNRIVRSDRFALVQAMAAAANRERERRQMVDDAQMAEARKQFYREFDAIAARRRAVLPHWRERTEEERAEGLRQLDEWAAERAKQG